jgi:hypothetical protein
VLCVNMFVFVIFYCTCMCNDCRRQSMHFSLYMPLLLYLLLLSCFRCRCFYMVFVVLHDILVSVSLNILAVGCVSHPGRLNVINLFRWYFLWCALGSQQRCFLFNFCFIKLFGIGSVVVYTLLFSSLYSCEFIFIGYILTLLIT